MISSYCYLILTLLVETTYAFNVEDDSYSVATDDATERSINGKTFKGMTFKVGENDDDISYFDVRSMVHEVSLVVLLHTKIIAE